MNSNLKIPYGVSDFKRLRSEGFYFVDKSAYIRTLELKFSKADATETDLAAKYQEALDQLAKYRAEESMPS